MVSVPANPVMEQDCYRNGLIIWYKNAFDEVRTQESWTRDFGLSLPPSSGLHIWEGDLDAPAVGTWRVPTAAEWVLIQQNLNPFN